MGSRQHESKWVCLKVCSPLSNYVYALKASEEKPKIVNEVLHSSTDTLGKGNVNNQAQIMKQNSNVEDLHTLSMYTMP